MKGRKREPRLLRRARRGESKRSPRARGRRWRAGASRRRLCRRCLLRLRSSRPGSRARGQLGSAFFSKQKKRFGGVENFFLSKKYVERAKRKKRKETLSLRLFTLSLPPSAAPGSGPELRACLSCTAPGLRRPSPAEDRKGEERKRRRAPAPATTTGRRARLLRSSHCSPRRRRRLALLLLLLRWVVAALLLGHGGR